MKDKIIQNMEYYLRMPGNYQYDILVHEPHQPRGTATLLYAIREDNICDGDGIWLKYDDKSVKISCKDYHHVKSIFKSCGNEIVKLGEENGLPIEREIKENDCNLLWRIFSVDRECTIHKRQMDVQSLFL